MRTEPLEYLVKKGSYFYRPNSQGYTALKFDAGRYTKSEAEKIAAIEPSNMKAIHQDEVPDETKADSEITALRTALIQQRAWVKHWQDDLSSNLKPTPESLQSAASSIDAALSIANRKISAEART